MKIWKIVFVVIIVVLVVLNIGQVFYTVMISHERDVYIEVSETFNEMSNMLVDSLLTEEELHEKEVDSLENIINELRNAKSINSTE